MVHSHGQRSESELTHGGLRVEYRHLRPTRVPHIYAERRGLATALPELDHGKNVSTLDTFCCARLTMLFLIANQQISAIESQNSLAEFL